MPVPTNTLLIEGSFAELAEELALYIDNIRKNAEGGLQPDVAPLLEKLRQQEQSEEELTDDQQEQVLKQRDEVLKKVVLGATALNAAPEKEIVAAYNLLIHLIRQSFSVEMFLSRVCSYLAKPITSSPQHGASIALTVLSTVFNTLAPTDSVRYHVFLAVVAAIRNTSSSTAFEALKPQITNQLQNWVAAWELDEEESQKLYLAIADAARDAGDKEMAHEHVVLALQTIPPAEASSPEARELAVRALTSALKLPSVFDFTPLTASDAIQSLRSTDTSLFELLEIFAADTLDAYEEFIASTPLASIKYTDGDDEDEDSDEEEEEEEKDLSSAAETLQTKMRLLTLATLAASTSSRSLPYTTISEALRVEPSEVEKWVIDTIRAGLVEGKLSQSKSEFLVQRATYRVFGEKQWAEVHGRLMVWQRSLESVLGVVRSEREKFMKEGVAGANTGATAGGAGEGGREKRRGGGGQQQQQPREVDVGGRD
ncbi:hypothetical protein FQN54_000610 [Arachnomyces sp. PD_36]|nr:hypothetical protein FQN54_000610 [Arachnomyces sp. PD_36]